jgi:hypothetical protein
MRCGRAIEVRLAVEQAQNPLHFHAPHYPDAGCLADRLLSAKIQQPCHKRCRLGRKPENTRRSLEKVIVVMTSQSRPDQFLSTVPILDRLG